MSELLRLACLDRDLKKGRRSSHGQLPGVHRLIHRPRPEVHVVALPTIPPLSQHNHLPVSKGTSVSGCGVVGLAMGWLLEDETIAPISPSVHRHLSPHNGTDACNPAIQEGCSKCIQGCLRLSVFCFVVWCYAVYAVHEPPHHFIGR